MRLFDRKTPLERLGIPPEGFVPDPTLTVYVASKASEPCLQMWRTLRDVGVPILSAWFDDPGERGMAIDATDLAEIQSSRLFLLYGDPSDDDFARAAMALGCGIPVAGVEVPPWWTGILRGHPFFEVHASVHHALSAHASRSVKPPSQGASDLDPDIQRAVDLVLLCQDLKSEKDGVPRTSPFLADPGRHQDPFSGDVGRTVCLLVWLQELRGMEERLRAFAVRHPEFVGDAFGIPASERTLAFLDAFDDRMPTGRD